MKKEYLIKYEPIEVNGIKKEKYNIYFLLNGELDPLVIPQFYGTSLTSPVTEIPSNYTKHPDSL